MCAIHVHSFRATWRMVPGYAITGSQNWTLYYFSWFNHGQRGTIRNLIAENQSCCFRTTRHVHPSDESDRKCIAVGHLTPWLGRGLRCMHGIHTVETFECPILRECLRTPIKDTAERLHYRGDGQQYIWPQDVEQRRHFYRCGDCIIMRQLESNVILRHTYNICILSVTKGDRITRHGNKFVVFKVHVRQRTLVLNKEHLWQSQSGCHQRTSVLSTRAPTELDVAPHRHRQGIR